MKLKLKLNKIGPHIQIYTSPAKAWTRVSPIVKIIDNNPKPFHDAPSDAIRVFRIYQDVNLTHDGGKEGARNQGRWLASTAMNRLGGYDHPNLYIQVDNEEKEKVGHGLEDHLDILEEASSELHHAGYKCAGIGWSMGGYGAADWEYARSRAFGGVDAILLNAYTVPNNNNYALRYREFWKAGDPPIIIGEFNTLYGWWVDSWSIHNKWDSCLDFCSWFDGEISKDPYVLGACGFTAGPEQSWIDFDFDPVVERLLPLYSETKEGEKTPMPQPEKNRDSNREWYPISLENEEGMNSWLDANKAAFGVSTREAAIESILQAEFGLHQAAISGNGTHENLKHSFEKVKSGLEQAKLLTRQHFPHGTIHNGYRDQSQELQAIKCDVEDIEYSLFP